MATTFRPEQLDEGSAEEQQQIQQQATQLPASILAVEDLPVLGAGWAHLAGAGGLSAAF